MNEEDRIDDIKLIESIDDALKYAKSLVYWIEFVKDNPLKVDNPMSSFGGHILGNLSVLNAWIEIEKIKASLRGMKK